MHLETKNIETLAKKLNLSMDQVISESLKYFIEKKLREIKAEIFSIGTRYGVSTVDELENLYRTGKIEEKNSRQDFQKLDHLEYKKKELQKTLDMFK